MQLLIKKTYTKPVIVELTADLTNQGPIAKAVSPSSENSAMTMGRQPS